MKNPRVCLVSLVATLCLTSVISRHAAASWPADPSVNVPLCTASGDQVRPTMTSDGAGGVIVTWQDSRWNSYNFDIYAQHVLANGSLDPAWALGGVAVCAAAWDQYDPTILSDGSGGAFIAWWDLRSGLSHDLYAQHLLADGTADPAWPLNGLAVCFAPGSQSYPMLVSDGSGGVLVTWADSRNPPWGASSNLDIYAQHVLSSGALDPTWPMEGLAVCTVGDDQFGPQIVSDGAHGAVIVWTDRRANSYYASSYDIYAARVLSTGQVDPAWPAGGLVVCAAPDYQRFPAVSPDGAGGALVAWEDGRSNNLSPTLYAQRVQVTGNLDPAWPEGGLALCPGVQAHYPGIAADRAGNAVVAWTDGSISGGILGNSDVYAQRLLSNGQLDPAWPSRGLELCAAQRNQEVTSIVADGAGGATVVWQDNRNGNYYNSSYDIYAQHVLARGSIDIAWPIGGLAVCSAERDQMRPVALADGLRGAVIVWDDRRSGSNLDLYAQRIAWSDLPTPTMLVQMVAEATAEGILVHWTFANADAFQRVRLERARSASGEFEMLPMEVRSVSGAMVALDADVTSGCTYWYRIAARAEDGRDVTFPPISATASEWMTEVALTGASPNPTTGPLQVEFTLPEAASVRIEVIDAMGREAAVVSDEWFAAGRHRVAWNGVAGWGTAPAGIYFVRLNVGGKSLSRRVAILN